MTNGYMKLTSRRVSFGALIKLVARGSRIRLGTWGILGQHMRGVSNIKCMNSRHVE
jgi:hypothetical protein